MFYAIFHCKVQEALSHEDKDKDKVMITASVPSEDVFLGLVHGNFDRKAT